MPRYFKKRIADDDKNPFSDIKVYIPKSTHFQLKKISAALNKPVSRLVAIAIDNELDAEKPFNYPTPMPQTLYVKLLHLTNAMKLYDFIKSAPNGITIESLVLCRSMFGITNRNDVMEAYRELLMDELIEEYESVKTNDTSILVKAVEKGSPKKIKDSKHYVKRLTEEENR